MKLLAKRLLSYFPTQLPMGVAAFETWADTVLELSGLPISRDSAHQALANMVMHLSPIDKKQTPRDKVSMNFFVKGLRKGATNQICAHVFYEIQKVTEEKRKALKDQEDPIGTELKQQVEDLGEATATAVDEKIRFQ